VSIVVMSKIPMKSSTVILTLPFWKVQKLVMGRNNLMHHDPKLRNPLITKDWSG
jgi:hypothetical protein